MTEYEQIFEQFKQGDMTLFYKSLYPQLIIYANNTLGADYAFLSEDYVQDAVYKSYERRTSFDSALQWRYFLYTCVRNAAYSLFRKNSAKDRYLNQIDVTEDTLTLNMIEQETIGILYEVIELLPKNCRELFELSFERGLKNAEVAEILGIAEITVKKRKARLIERLRDCLVDRLDVSSLTLLLFVLSQSL